MCYIKKKQKKNNSTSNIFTALLTTILHKIARNPQINTLNNIQRVIYIANDTIYQVS